MFCPPLCPFGMPFGKNAVRRAALWHEHIAKKKKTV